MTLTENVPFTANAFAERWARTVRAELLDWTLVLNRRHLDRLLDTYVTHYNCHRPHRGLGLAAPNTPLPGARPSDFEADMQLERSLDKRVSFEFEFTSGLQPKGVP